MPNDLDDIGQRDWLDDDCVLPFMVWVRKYSGLSEAPVDVLRRQGWEGRRWFVCPSVALECGWVIIGHG
jgi:hypothetical protein